MSRAAPAHRPVRYHPSARNSSRLPIARPVTIAAPDMQKDIELIVTSPSPDAKTLPDRLHLARPCKCSGRALRGSKQCHRLCAGPPICGKSSPIMSTALPRRALRVRITAVYQKNSASRLNKTLRDGTLKLLCATSSMELGIDVGDIDRVLQIGCPLSVSSTLQRLGRAGHNPPRQRHAYFPAYRVRRALLRPYGTGGAHGANGGRAPAAPMPRYFSAAFSLYGGGEAYTVDDVSGKSCRAPIRLRG